VYAQIVAVPDEGAEQTSGAAQQNGAAARQSQAPSRLCFYLDGAHTEESMATCAAWFAEAVAADPPAHALPAGHTRAAEPPAGGTGALGGLQQETQRLLLFNCMQVAACCRTP
jgi:folylpolyglutamate synthase